jgi:hypothetical protein
MLLRVRTDGVPWESARLYYYVQGGVQVGAPEGGHQSLWVFGHPILFPSLQVHGARCGWESRNAVGCTVGDGVK